MLDAHVRIRWHFARNEMCLRVLAVSRTKRRQAIAIALSYMKLNRCNNFTECSTLNRLAALQHAPDE